jgi:Protein of unknown function (DUF3071)
VRQLHLVGFTSDHLGLILAGRRGAKTGGYLVVLDDTLLEQIDSARRMGAGEPQREPPPPVRRTHAESALSPREIQARLRRGRTVAEVAVEAGVEMEWIERFAAPVLAEQAAAIARAGRLTLKTPRRGTSDRPLHQSVLRNLADRGVRMTDEQLAAAWSANQVVNGEWSIRFPFAARGGRYQAEWTLDLGEGVLIPKNRMGTELGFVDPARNAPYVRDLTVPVTKTPAALEAEDATEPAAPRKRPAAVKPRAAKKPAPAKKPVAKKTVAAKKPAARKKATTPTKRTAKRGATNAVNGANGARRKQSASARPRPLPEPALLAELVREVERPLKSRGNTGSNSKRAASRVGAQNHRNGS